jgi:H+/Cl- antiporter ClcA
MAIGAMGSGLASFIANLLKVDRRTEAAWVFSGMAGSLGALFPSPVLGVILAHELSVVGRPNCLTLDAVVAKETKDTEDTSQIVNHDFMEQVTLGGTAATCAYIVLHALPKSWQWNIVTEIGNDYHMWHLAVAVPLGVLCGLVASLALVFLGAFRSIRNKTCEVLEEKVGAPKWVGRLLFPTLAGVLHGLLAVWNPMLVGSGVLFITNLIENHASMRPGWLLLLAMSKALSMSLSLGFGLVGGPLIPMVYVGLCIGLACSFLVPLSLAVPCCMCATVGAFVPIPFTLVVCVALALSLTVEQMGPVFVATMLAYACTGGLGVIRRMGERRLGTILGDDLMGFHDHPSDYSIVQGIRYTIFGNP